MHMKDFAGPYTWSTLGLLFYITCMYTKLVVIVNAENIVDKSVNLMIFNDLSNVEVAVQVLYQSGTTVGQDFDCVQVLQFCTTDPVDIQGLIHST